MDFRDYQNRALRTWNHNLGDNHRRMNALCGIISEAGEIADAMKKYLFHQSKDYEECRTALYEECGDLLYYLVIIMQEFNLDVNIVADANIRKLKTRHGDRFQKVYRKVDARTIIERAIKEAGDNPSKNEPS